MAEATKTTRTVTTTEEAFTLTLSADEFAWLKDLIGSQPADVNASASIWEAMKSPAEVQEGPIREGDRVRVLPGAESRNGSRLGFEGLAIVTNGLDSDGDYFVRAEDHNDGGYVLAQYLRRA